jgi:hypothetical protein
MIDLFELYESLQARVNSQQGGHIRPNRNFMKWVNETNLDLFEELYEDFEKSQNISDKLTPFLVTVNIVFTPNKGAGYDQITKPKDYGRYGTMRAYKRSGAFCGLPGMPCLDCNFKPAPCPDILTEDEIEQISASQDENLKEVPIEKIENSRWAAQSQRISKAPTVNSPKVTEYDKGFKILPKNLGVIVLDYFRLPVTPVFNYSLTGQGTENEIIQYNKSGSTQLEWNPTVISDFLDRLEAKYFKFIRQREMVKK